MLKGHLLINKSLPKVQTLSSQVFAGKVKKGMPGFSEFGTLVEVQVGSLMNLLIEILNMRADEAGKMALNPTASSS